MIFNFIVNIILLRSIMSFFKTFRFLFLPTLTATSVGATGYTATRLIQTQNEVEDRNLEITRVNNELKSKDISWQSKLDGVNEKAVAYKNEAHKARTRVAFINVDGGLGDLNIQKAADNLEALSEYWEFNIREDGEKCTLAHYPDQESDLKPCQKTIIDIARKIYELKQAIAKR